MTNEVIQLCIRWVVATHVLLDLVGLPVAGLKFSIEVQLFFIIFQDAFRSFDVVIDRLATNVKILRNLA